MDSETVVVDWPVPLPLRCAREHCWRSAEHSSPFCLGPWRRDGPDTQAVRTPTPGAHLSAAAQPPGPVLPGPSSSGQLSLGTSPEEGRANSSHCHQERLQALG